MKYLENPLPCVEKPNQKRLDKEIPEKQNTYGAKLRRILKSHKPIDPNRQGKCLRCGACCKLPNRCIFLAYDEEGQAVCALQVYFPYLKPEVCKRYPGDKEEFITQKTCGYWFTSRKISN